MRLSRKWCRYLIDRWDCISPTSEEETKHMRIMIMMISWCMCETDEYRNWSGLLVWSVDRHSLSWISFYCRVTNPNVWYTRQSLLGPAARLHLGRHVAGTLRHAGEDRHAQSHQDQNFQSTRVRAGTTDPRIVTLRPVNALNLPWSLTLYASLDSNYLWMF